MEIAKIVGSDDATETKSGDDQGSRIELPLIEIMKLAPHAFRQASAPPPVIKVAVIIPDLFDQLTKGKVNVPLSTLIANVPLDARSAEATMHGDEMISLPLPLIVSCINPNELQKRTAKQEVDRGEKFLPNLFTPGSLKKPAATPQPSPAAAVPAAPPPSIAKPPPAITLPPSPIKTSTPPPARPFAPPPQTLVPPPPARSPDTVVAPPTMPAPVAAAMPPLVTPPPAIKPQTLTPPPESKPAPVVQLPLVPVAPSLPVAPAPAVPAPVINAPKPPETILAPKVAPAPATAAPVEAETPVASRAEAAARDAREQKASIEAAIEEATIHDHGLHLYGVDINTASAEEMVTRFNGVGRKLAEKIVANRVEFGAFKDVYDLARVQGVKGKVFQRITGMAWPAQLFRHREEVARLIGVVGNEIPDVRGVAQRFRELEGFTGCIMIDQDGLVLARTWEHPSAEALGAFAPQMFKKLSRYVKQLKLGHIKTLTFFADEQPVTLVTSGAILFVALHKATRFSKRQVELIQALATELGRKLQR